MLFFNRKAYTLSQFIILWILGILLVILIYQNIVRYRATIQAREAEAFMQKVRTEQEDRCGMGRKYAVSQNHLKSFYKRENTTPSIQYDLSSGQGITAHHKLLDFRLQMPSYADGRICCDNCEKLDRYYPRCNVLKKRKNFISPEPECMFYAPKESKTSTESKKSSPSSASARPETREPVEKLMGSEQEKAKISEQESAQVSGASVELGPGAENKSQEEQSSSSSESSTSVTEPVQEGKQESVPMLQEESAKRCKVPAKGEFFIDECSVYQTGTQGSVVHTWNEEKCTYDVTQSCILPSKWQSVSSTKEEKGLYPSDLEEYCPQLIKSAPCRKEATAGQECGSVNFVCYKDCKIVEQTEVKESSLVILYDVKLEIKKLRCMPAKDVTVSVS